MSKREKTPTKDSALKRDLNSTKYRQRVKPDEKKKLQKQRHKDKLKSRMMWDD